jgi:hypothetical protein
MKLTESHLISQFEQGTIMKAYQAVDALSYDFVKRTLGAKWIKDNYYIPFSIFGPDYSINPISYVATIPYEDTFRTRFWPTMAHEVAHVLLHKEAEIYKTTQKSPLTELLLDSIGILMDSLKWKKRIYAELQVAELFCDIISAYVCPCVIITGSLRLRHSFEREPETLAKVLPFFTHPTGESRMIAMKSVLEENGLLEADVDLNRFLESVMIFNNRKMLYTLGPKVSQNVMLEYNKVTEMISKSVVDILKNMNIIPFKASDWKKIVNRISSKDFTNLSPTLLMNLLWIRRLKEIKGDAEIDISAYYSHRRNEPQLLEFVINSFYKYYADEIASRIEGGIDDLRINTC